MQGMQPSAIRSCRLFDMEGPLLLLMTITLLFGDSKAGPGKTGRNTPGDQALSSGTTTWHDLMQYAKVVNNFCKFSSWNHVECCMGLYFVDIGFRNNVCLKVTEGPDKATGSQYMVRIAGNLDIFKLLEVSASEVQPVTTCLHLPLFPSVRACLQLANLKREPEFGLMCVCVDNLFYLTEGDPLFTIKDLCTCHGMPWKDEDKQWFAIKDRGIVKNAIDTISKIFLGG